MTVSFHGKWYLLWNTFTTVDVTVQCFDLMLLEALCPDVHKEFMAGNFSFQKQILSFQYLLLIKHTSRTTKISRALEEPDIC